MYRPAISYFKFSQYDSYVIIYYKVIHITYVHMYTVLYISIYYRHNNYSFSVVYPVKIRIGIIMLNFSVL